MASGAVKLMGDFKDVRDYEKGYHDAERGKEYGMIDVLFGPDPSHAYWQGYKEGKEDKKKN
jgi:hypothetical protein